MEQLRLNQSTILTRSEWSFHKIRSIQGISIYQPRARIYDVQNISVAELDFHTRGGRRVGKALSGSPHQYRERINLSNLVLNEHTVLFY